MQVIEDHVYKEVRDLPGRQMNVDPVSNSPQARVSQRPETRLLFYGLHFGTIILILLSGILAVLAICLGAVLGSELQKCRYMKPLILSLSNFDQDVLSVSA